MPITPPPAIDAPPTAPSTNSPSTFDALADAFVAYWTTFRTQIVAALSWLYDTAVAAYDAALAAAASAGAAAASEAVALAAANFKGTWSSRTGAAAVPYSVSHAGSYWMLLGNLADVTASEPGVTADWQRIGAAPWTTIDHTDSPYTATVGEHLRVDTSGGAVTVVLPDTAPAGEEVAITDHMSSFATYNCTVTAGTDKIDQDAAGFVLDLDGETRVFTKTSDTAVGWGVS